MQDQQLHTSVDQRLCEPLAEAVRVLLPGIVNRLLEQEELKTNSDNIVAQQHE